MEHTDLTHHHDIYNEAYVSELVEDDAISSQEAAFLAGYEEASTTYPPEHDS